MHAIPEIIENKTAPVIASLTDAPTKKPTIPAMTIMITDTAVLKLFHMSLPSEISVYTYIITFRKIKVK